MKKIIVLQAGLSTPSSTRLLAEQLAGAVQAQVSARGEGLDVEFIDIRDYATDLATVMTTGIPSATLTAAQERISAADGLIAATPVFTSSYSGLFKMFFDTLGTDSLNGMPVIIAATAGTARHSLVLDYALRPMFTYLRAVVMPTGVFAATDDFGADSGLEGRISRAAAELTRQLLSSGTDVVAGFSPDVATAVEKPTAVGEHRGDSPGEMSVQRGAAPRRTSGTRVEAGLDFGALLKHHDGNG